MLTWREILEAEEVDDRRTVGEIHPAIPVDRQGRALILDLNDKEFKVLSSGFTNGGYSDDPQAVINMSGSGGKPEFSVMMGGLDEFDESVARYVEKLGLDPKRCVCMNTAANMDNAIITNAVSVEGIGVSSAITAGIRHNGGRPGDPSYYDEAADTRGEKSGTIIILISIDADLSESAMLSFMMMVTEAKSCVVQELQARSLYSPNIATGSGTDQVAVIVKKGSKRIDGFSRTSDLAFTIADCVKKGLREALARQSGMDIELQTDVMTILSRYNLIQNTIREEIRFPATMEELMDALEVVRSDKYLATLAMAVLNIQDGIRNGRISEKEGLDVARSICENEVLGGVRDKVERIRLDSAESIPDLVSYTAALKLLRTVEERRCCREE